jgi:hypothetical protein
MIVLNKVFLAVRKITISTFLCTVLVGCQTSLSGKHAKLHPGYIEGHSLFDGFVLHENELGFSELQSIFLASVSAARLKADRLPLQPKGKRIKLVMREPYYLMIGLEPQLVTNVELIWPIAVGRPYLIVNDFHWFELSDSSKSTGILLTWAAGRGYK